MTEASAAPRGKSVGDDELGYPQPVRGRDRLSDQVPGGQVTQKTSIGVHPKSRADQVVGLVTTSMGTTNGLGCVSSSSKQAW